MPANWITERPTTQRRMPVEAPRLELPVPRPVFERAQPSPEPSLDRVEPAERRGAVLVDFYI
jgi:hypothetical protein